MKVIPVNKFQKNFKHSILMLLYEIILRKSMFSRIKALGDSQPMFGSLFDYITVELYVSRVFEGKSLEFAMDLLRFLRKTEDRIFTGVAVDVGANIGNHTRFFSTSFTSVVSIEPHPITYELLRLNTRHLLNVECLNVALSNKPGFKYMGYPTTNLGGLDTHDEPDSFKVVATTLDRLLEPNLQVAFIKIDVEGREGEVLQGAIDVIRNNRPFIVFEYAPALLTDASICPFSVLESLGYQSYRIEKKGFIFRNSKANLFARFFSLLSGSDTYKLKRIDKVPKVYLDNVISLHEENLTIEAF